MLLKRFIIIYFILNLSFFLISLEITIDTNGNNKIDRWLNIELFKNWKKLDLNKNNKPDESYFYTTGENKIYFIQEEKFDYSLNGKPDIWIKNIIEGKNIKTEIKADKDNNGKIELIIIKENDVIKLKKADINNDGNFDFEEIYNNRGIKIKEAVDTNNDGKMDDFYHFENNILKFEELDTNFDAKFDFWVVFIYNDNLSIKECIIKKDNNYDGKVDEWHYSDNKRRVKRIEKDTDFDGVIDKIKKF